MWPVSHMMNTCFVARPFVRKFRFSIHPKVMKPAISMLRRIPSTAINHMSTNLCSDMMTPWPQRLPYVSTFIIPPTTRKWYAFFHLARTIIRKASIIFFFPTIGKHFNFSFPPPSHSFNWTKFNPKESATVLQYVETRNKACPYHFTDGPTDTSANSQFM